MRSGAARAQCASQSPTQRAAGFKDAVDLTMVEPSPRCSATIAGVAKRLSGLSPRTAAIVIVYSLVPYGLAASWRAAGSECRAEQLLSSTTIFPNLSGALHKL